MPDLILKNDVVSIGCKWSGWKFKSNRTYLVLDVLFELSSEMPKLQWNIRKREGRREKAKAEVENKES